MATRLATTRNFITVTAVPQNDNDDGCKTEVMESHSENNSASDVQCTTQITPVALHHVNLSQVRHLWNVDSFCPSFSLPNNSTIRQKKIILQTGTNGGVSVIDVVPLESSDSSDSQILVAESLASNGQNENGQQVTAQGKRNFLFGAQFPISANDRIWFVLNFSSCRCASSRIAGRWSAAFHHSVRQATWVFRFFMFYYFIHLFCDSPTLIPFLFSLFYPSLLTICYHTKPINSISLPILTIKTQTRHYVKAEGVQKLQYAPLTTVGEFTALLCVTTIRRKNSFGKNIR